MAYVPVPKDLTKVKTKVAFNLTKRQLICFTGGRADRRTAFLFAPRSCGKQRSSHVYDAGHAALLHARHVRETRPALGKDRGEYHPCHGDSSQAAPV